MGFDIDDDYMKEFKSMLITPFIIVDVVTSIFMAVGGIIIFGVFAQMFRTRHSRRVSERCKLASK